MGTAGPRGLGSITVVDLYFCPMAKTPDPFWKNGSIGFKLKLPELMTTPPAISYSGSVGTWMTVRNTVPVEFWA